MTNKKEQTGKLLEDHIIEKVCANLQQSIKNPAIELKYTTDYTLLVAVILSAQSTDVGVNKATAKLFPLYDTPSKILSLGEEGLKQYIKTIGLYNNKAKNVIKMSEILLNNFDSKVPSNFDDLVSLPGVGRKSANVILNCLYGHHTIAVDTHVFRVSNRIGLCSASNVLETEKQLNKRISEKYKSIIHHLLVLHGRYKCKAKKPDCATCSINKYCIYYNTINKHNS